MGSHIEKKPGTNALNQGKGLRAYKLKIVMENSMD